MKVGVLGSTRGTTLRGILQAIEQKELVDIKVSCVISSKERAKILETCKDFNVHGIYLNPENISKEAYESQLTAHLKHHKVEYVLLIGWMQILSPHFVNEWKGKLLNVHPSLLPAFAGLMNLQVHRAVLDRGCQVSGATIMFVDHGVDTGPILCQGVVPVLPNDSPTTLKTRVQKMEVKCFIHTLQAFQKGQKAQMLGLSSFMPQLTPFTSW